MVVLGGWAGFYVRGNPLAQPGPARFRTPPGTTRNPRTWNLIPKSRNTFTLSSETYARIPKPETRIPILETRTPTFETRNPKPETRNPNPESRNPTPETRIPKAGAIPEQGDDGVRRVGSCPRLLCHFHDGDGHGRHGTTPTSEATRINTVTD